MPKKIRYTTEQFIHLARQKHGNMYDYSQTSYVESHYPVTILCKKHGSFFQKAYSHLQGAGCNLCGIENTRINFLERAKTIHGNKYQYPQLLYERLSDRVIIVCSEHGPFEQIARNHLRGCGCPMCGRKRKSDGVYCDVFFSRHKNISGSFYVIEMNDNKESFLKIGVTKNDVNTLLSRYKHTGYSCEIVNIQDMDLIEAFTKEQSLLEALSKMRYVPNRRFSGWTECLETQAKKVLTNE